jgi:hypothetical protein
MWDTYVCISNMPWRFVGSVAVRVLYILCFVTASRYILIHNLVAVFLASAGRARIQGILGLIHIFAFPQGHKDLQFRLFCHYSFRSHLFIYHHQPLPPPKKDTSLYQNSLVWPLTGHPKKKKKSVSVSAIPVIFQYHWPQNRLKRTNRQILL